MPETNNLVSIIIACYNDPDVAKAIEFAYMQSYINKEIIVVDDGSNIETKEIITEKNDKINIVITQENSGQSIARNNGISKASGKYILNWDSDDYFEPEFIQEAVEKFEEEANIKIITCKTRRFNKRGKIDVFTPLGGDLQNFLFSNSAMGSSMFKKIDWQACGGYEEKLPILGFEDWEFYLNILKTGGVAYVIPKVLFHYQVRKNSTTATIKHLKKEKFKYIIFKHSEIYKENFENLVTDLFTRMAKEEMLVQRRATSMDYQIGNTILTPLRWLKKLIK